MGNVHYLKYVSIVASVLLIIGGINWGLFGFFNINLVTLIFTNPMLAKAVYGLIALAALYHVYEWFKCSSCPSCKS